MNELAILRDQLIALEATASAAIALLDEALGEGDPGGAAADGPCPHPPAKRRVASAMGGVDRFLCLACGQVVSPSPPSSETGGAP